MYPSPNIVRVIKFRTLRWAGHVARMEESRSALKILTGIPAGKRPLGRLLVDGRTILEWILKEIGVNTRDWVDSTQDRNY